MITNKKHYQIVGSIVEEKNKVITEYVDKTFKLQKELREKEKELDEARDLKEILKTFATQRGKFEGYWTIATTVNEGGEFCFPDTVLQYTDDILGGKVIKQEGTKCLIVTKEGDVKTGLTKQKPDKGYGYKLVRE